MARFSLFALFFLLFLSCSKETPSPTAPPAAASAGEAGPWQTVEINGALYRRVVAKPTETSQADLLITIPISYETTADGAIRLSDTVQIAGRTYTADCGADGSQSGGGDDVGNTPATATSILVQYPPLGTSEIKTVFSPESVSESHELTRGDTDYFRLSVTRRVYLGVGSNGPTDVVGQLLDENGVVLDSQDNNRTSDNNNFFLFALVEPGTYYVKVTGASSSTTGPYYLGISTSYPSAGKVVAEQSIATAHKKSLGISR
ncbi:MAG: hypothetical protein OXM01_07270 [Gemmatimonadota bacterium]|nr:hypothetical protein [Gemmatimonadota bacterium]